MAHRQLHDLLFISAYGEENDRGVSFAHFSHDPESPADLPVLKVLGWDDGDTVLHIADAQQTLTEKLRGRLNRESFARAAKDLDRGLRLFKSQILVLAQADSLTAFRKWNPFGTHGSCEFWTFLCANFPERVFHELLGLKVELSKVEGFYLGFDLEKDREVLLPIVTQNHDAAIFFAENVSGASKGFFPVAYALMDAFPTSEPLRLALTNAALYQTGDGANWGNYENYEQAFAGIESEIAKGAPLVHHLSWLNGLKSEIQKRRKTSRSRSREGEYLGWN